MGILPVRATAGGVRSEKAFYAKSLSSAPTNPGSGYSGWGHKSGHIWRYYKTGTGAGWKEIDLSAIDGSRNGDFTTLKTSSTAGWKEIDLSAIDGSRNVVAVHASFSLMLPSN